MRGPVPVVTCIIIIITAMAMAPVSRCAKALGRVEAVFGIGDSYLDGGNNKFITGSLFSATFPPYGIDYIPNSGRFTNGMTLLDVIATRLGLPVPPASLSPNADFSRGINYGSSAGATQDFPFLKGRVLSMWDQLHSFQRVAEAVANNSSDPHLPSPSAIQSGLYVICFPDNDYDDVVRRYLWSPDRNYTNVNRVITEGDINGGAGCSSSGGHAGEEPPSRNAPDAAISQVGLSLLWLCEKRGASACAALLRTAATQPRRLTWQLTREVNRVIRAEMQQQGGGVEGKGEWKSAGLSGGQLNATSVLASVFRMRGVLRALANTSYSMARNIADAVKFLYSLGARRFLVVKTQALGCVPYVRSFYPKPFPAHCVQLANALGISNNLFYGRALRQARLTHRDADIFEFKWYELWQAVYSRPQAFGFKSHEPCCVGPVWNNTVTTYSCGFNFTTCAGVTIESHVCNDPTSYFFWDVYHPSQAGYEKIVDMLLKDSPMAVYPRGIRQALGMQ